MPAPVRTGSSDQPLGDPVSTAALELLALGYQHGEAEKYLAAALPVLLRAVHATGAAVVEAASGGWTTIGSAGVATALPTDLLSEALDRDAPSLDGRHLAVPLPTGDASQSALVLNYAQPVAGLPREVGPLAQRLAEALRAVRERGRQQRRMHRLEAILGIANRWNQQREMEPLLREIAEAATSLLEADRASIFLWDKPNHSLVGRPALGVEGGELRIADTVGVVGQVVQTGQARRVDAGAEAAEIDREVDARVDYQTRNLLCVPLNAPGGERLGAFEVLNKRRGNFTREDEEALAELASHAAVALENTQDRADLLKTRRAMSDEAASHVQLVGESPAIELLRSTIARVAPTDLALLILGENGTGKEVVSQAIHYASPRRNQPFIAVNCAAISETLLESELFGHEKGAFTDAHETRSGKFELASGGTLLLDEIGDLSLSGQAKLLRVLEEKVVVRVGGSKSIPTDARVIAATNQPLADMVRSKRFREDLYFRLNVVALEVPPLRERPEDVAPLAEYFLNQFSKKARRKPPKLSASARRRLEIHAWPGNVRELRNMMERMAYLHAADRIEAEDIAFIISPASRTATGIDPSLPLTDATQQFQVAFIDEAIRRAGGHMSAAAERLGLHRSNLYRKMRQLGMQPVD